MSLESPAVFSRPRIPEGDGKRAAGVRDRERATTTPSNPTSSGASVVSVVEVRRVVARRGAKRPVPVQASPRSASRLLAEIKDVG